MSQKEIYQWYKEHGICVRCHKRDAEPHRVKCFECAEQQRIVDSKRVRSKEEHAKQQREITRRKKEQGICYRCKKKATHGVFCYEHFIYSKRKDRERKTKKGFGEIGLCRICGEEPSPGKKLCPVHCKEYADRLNKRNKERRFKNEKGDN